MAINDIMGYVSSNLYVQSLLILVLFFIVAKFVVWVAEKVILKLAVKTKTKVDDLIIEDQTAVVFDPNDELSITRTLQRLLDGREFARKIANNAQEYLRNNHSVSKMISATLQVYHEVQE